MNRTASRHRGGSRTARHVWRPGWLERLEDRIAPATNLLLVNGIEFLGSSNFTQHETKTTYSLGGGYVDIGYAPFPTETFLPLVRATLEDAGKITVDIDPATASFSLTDAGLSIVVVSGSPSIPLPVWK